MSRKFRRGLTTQATSYDHIRGKLDSEAMLEDLGIDIGFRHSPTQIMCHCPDMAGNHKNGDANPSFGFNEEKLAYNCFVCGGGNVLELVQMMRPDLDDEAALRYLESFSDLQAGTQDELIGKLQAILNPVEEKPEPMPEYPDSALFHYKKIHPYLYERGLTKDIITEMQVGFDDEHCGIVIPHSFQGRLRGWQIRHLAQDDEGNYMCPVHSCNFKNEKPIKVPKYKNTTNFPKINTLYGYDRLKQTLQVEAHEAVLVIESPFSALYMMSLGFDNVVATFGQFNVEQGMLLLPFEHVIFWPDHDAAGHQNTHRAIESVARYNRLSIVPAVDLPKGDPADLDLEGIKQHLENTYSSSLYPMFAATSGIPPTLAEVHHETRKTSLTS